METKMELTFLGATGTVTGSKYLLKADDKNILIDCGLFQGLKALRLQNWRPFPVDPASIDLVILTHAHIDHSGYLPLLVKQGFKGKIYCTKATLDLCAILLPDSGYLQEEGARFANRHGFSKHKPALPLYTEEDAENSLVYFDAVPFNKEIPVAKNLTFCFQRVGHILGAASAIIQHHETRVMFTGDVGRLHSPVMYPPQDLTQVDYLVVESTYGNNLHRKNNPQDDLAKIINKTVARGGSIIIPAFAVGRTQNLLYYLYQLKKNRLIPDIPIYLDSPMATEATKLFYEHADEHQLSHDMAANVCRVANYVNTVDASKAIDYNPEPKIIISASGMITGGRILHHVKTYASDARNTLLITGYQAAGTRGEALLHGKKELKMFGRFIPIAAEVLELHNTSAHADYDELLKWLSTMPNAPKKVFITHGEEAARQAFKEKLADQFMWQCELPTYMQTVTLT